MPACNRCHYRKTKCDRKTPECGSCVRSCVPCHYPTKRQNRKEDCHVEALERENAYLRNQLNLTSAGSSSIYASRNFDSGVDRPDHEHAQINDQSSGRRQTPARPEASVTTGHNSQGDVQHSLSTETCRSHDHYLGSSTSAHFVDMVESVVAPSPGGGDLCRAATKTQVHSMPDLALPTNLQPWSLPTKTVAMPLVTAYFNHWHLTFPLLYRPDFMDMMERIYREPEFYKEDPESAFAFEMVLALGSATSKRFEWSFGDTESYYTRAITKLDRLSDLKDIRSLQALLLCCQYGIHASLRDTSAEMWHLLGKASRLCIELGLHKRSTALLARCETYLTGPLAPALHTEMQSRCFWCCYNLDRFDIFIIS